MPPAEVAVAVLRRATAPRRRWDADPTRIDRSGPSASGRPDAADGRAADRDRPWSAPARPQTRVGPGIRAAQLGRADVTAQNDATAAEAEATLPRRLDGRTKRAAGRAAYLAAMLCPMGRNGTRSVRPCKRRREDLRMADAVSGASAPRASRQIDLARRGRDVQVERRGGVGAPGRRGARAASRRRRGSSGRSGPRGCPSARALPSVPSMSGP